MIQKVPCALTIAGSDSGGGAGIQADLKTFAALGVHGMSALTAITAQNTISVTAVQDVKPEIVKAQIEAVIEDFGVDAAKTGMLHTIEIIKVVAEEIEKHHFPVVVDPVMIAKSGAKLLKPKAIDTLIMNLLPKATVVTPNAMEAETIGGTKIKSLEDAKEVAKKISKLGPKAVVVKGGHLPLEKKAVDVLFYEDNFYLFEAERLDVKTTHGTGCTFSSAIAAELAKGKTVVEAVKIAKDFVDKAIRFGLPLGHGYGPVNPMANLYGDAERYAIIREMKDAVRMLEESSEFAVLIPEVGSNLVMASSYARDFHDVAGIPGRIVRSEKGVRATSCPEFGVSKHVANTVLTVMKYDPAIRAAINIRYSEKTLKACERLGLKISFYNRREEPPEVKKAEGMSTIWGAEEAVKRIRGVPDVIYHDGDWGKEAMITLLGNTALHVATVAVRVAKEIK